MQFNVKGILRTFVNTCTMAILRSTMTFCGEKKLLKKHKLTKKWLTRLLVTTLKD